MEGGGEYTKSWLSKGGCLRENADLGEGVKKIEKFQTSFVHGPLHFRSLVNWPKTIDTVCLDYIGKRITQPLKEFLS